MPLIASGTVLGTLNTAAFSSSVYDSEAEDTLTQMATVLACILERRRLYEATLEAKKEAEMANRAKSTFLSQMTHELRTPMNGVIGMLQLLKETSMTEEQADIVRTIGKSSNILLANINDILDFSKIEAGKLDLEKTDIHLQQLLEDTFAMLGSQLSKKNLYLVYSIDDDVPTWITQDKARLQQILMNLLSNAVKFTESGGIDLNVRVHEMKQDEVALTDE